MWRHLWTTPFRKQIIRNEKQKCVFPSVSLFLKFSAFSQIRFPYLDSLFRVLSFRLKNWGKDKNLEHGKSLKQIRGQFHQQNCTQLY